jgi:hypothetical protein
MSLTLGRGMVGRPLGDAAVFDPAVLALSGWWRASYAGSPWVSRASAGSSGANGNLAEATNPPATGAAVNGLTPADFDGSNDQLLNANDLHATFLSTSAFHITALVKFNTAGAAAAGAAYGERAVLADDTQGYCNFSHSTRGITLSHYDTATGLWREATVACGTGAWHLAHGWYDGVNLFVQLDSGAPVTGETVATPLPSVAGTVCVGRNYSGTAFVDGDIAEVMIATTNLGSTARTDIKSYVNSRYALAL